MKKRKRKLKLKNTIILIVLILILLLFIISLLNNDNTKLENIGYSKLEIEELEKLSDKELNIIYSYDYNSNLIYIIKSNKYNKENLDLYMNYTLKYNDIDYLNIIELINHENFKKKKASEYFKYLKQYNNINGIIKYVNELENNNIKLDNTTLELINEKYFINDYLDRYLTYYKDHKDLEYKEIITRVNSNLDFEFYVDSKEADTTKEIYTLVNKFNYLNESYIPDNLITIEGKYARDKAQLVEEAFNSFVKMADEANNNGLTIKVTTGYRSYNFQATLYNNYVKMDGVKNADTYSARPGFSEHQLGYSADLTNAKNVSFDEFENTNEYKWLKENAHKYGFILRYPKNKEYITGYIFEAWHYRYVGVEIATYIYENDITYEEYYAYFLR